ncbi:protein FAM53A-like [Saccoglossus kowalevskii]|uniref:Protein FAM53A-like n=1 Tax=Saccoglossus kowalevskii TaxID=10224 RepID=A0ABM0MHQ9_SACKO|nr:PREDICTED: protein FAM53A-like [Saccoglossus kowalevskii]
MVTVITEKLRNQSLEDVSTFEQIIPYRTRSRVKYFKNISSIHSLENKGGNLLVVNTGTTECDRRTKGNNQLLASKEDRAQQESCAAAVDGLACHTPPTPPKKRHCRSLSTGELSGNAKLNKWQPKASSIWKPVPIKYRDLVSISPQLQLASHGFGGPNLPIGINEFSTPPESPVPRPASATLDRTFTAPWLENSPIRHAHVLKARSLSLSEDFTESSSCATRVNSSVELPRKRFGLPRCRSQPCVLDRKGGLKRRRGDDIARPALDFEKMKETSYDRRRLDAGHSKQYLNVGAPRGWPTLFKEPDKFLGLMPIASSPCDSNLSSSVMITPTSSPTKQLNETDNKNTKESDRKLEDDEQCEGYYNEEDDEEEIFHLDSEDLDLESIERH